MMIVLCAACSHEAVLHGDARDVRDGSGADAIAVDASVDGPTGPRCAAGAPVLVSQNPTTSVTFGRLARAGNGHALALWLQQDNVPYASAFDGSCWSDQLDVPWFAHGTSPTVAASATALVAADSAGHVARWDGSAWADQATFSSGFFLASDGATFVGAWADPTGLWSVTSSDGQTWSTPQHVLTQSLIVNGLVGGPGGVLVWLAGSSQTIALVWHAGAWGPAATLAYSSTGLTCAAAVGSASALLACQSQAAFDANLFASGAWTSVPIGAPPNNTFALASDGTDYRVDYGLPMQSKILHAGQWSSAIDDQVKTTAVLYGGTASRAGTWTQVRYDASTPQLDYGIARASGGAAYGALAALLPDPASFSAEFTGVFTGWPGRTDATFAVTPSSGVTVLYVGLDL